MKKSFLAAIIILLSACNNEKKAYDATGTFEATETTVYAESNGCLMHFAVSEGDSLSLGQAIGLIDTTQLTLKIQQINATKAVYQSQKPDIQSQMAVIRQQLTKARQEEQRYRELVADGAAPRKMLDDAISQVTVLQRQLDAQLSTLNTQTSTLDSQLSMSDVQIEQLRDQLRKCHILSPIAGTILEKYVEQGELVSIGKPLLKMADTKQMFLRAYVTTAQLQNIKLGQAVKVMADYGGGNKHTYDGTISWISSRSEFTPKTILTDDERADQVYAIKIAVNNDGYIKIGMYGEVSFKR